MRSLTFLNLLRVAPALLLAQAGVAVVLPPGDARACGGCFHGEPAPGVVESPSVVTDHRMVLALSPSLTTLWDQVEYSGDPTEFAWVLPVRGEVVVGVGTDAFVDAIDKQTAPEIDSPRPPSCPRNYGGCGGGSTAGCSSSSSDGEDYSLGYQEDSGITVTGRSVVGPYASVQVHGKDEGSIVGWLRAHKYVVPADVEPMLKRYVDEGFDFLAVRLRPGRGVMAMEPIRVSWRGAYPSLPLRMVAAGVGTSVGIKLFVIGSGRWRTQNFATFAIDPSALTWDFATQRSDYTEVRNRMAQAYEGRAFAMEASVDVLATSLPWLRGAAPEQDGGALADTGADTGMGADAGADTYLDAGSDVALDSGTDSQSDIGMDSGIDSATSSDAALDGEVDSGLDAAVDASAIDSSSSDASSAEADVDVPDTTPPPAYDAGAPPIVDPYATDLEIAFGSHPSRRITRLRADLPARWLDADLELQADESQSALAPKLQVQASINGSSTCSTNRGRGGQQQGCSLGESSPSRPLRATIGLAMLALAGTLVRRATRRRR